MMMKECPMPTSFDGKLVVAISSRALFDLDESHEVYERDGVDAYTKHQSTMKTNRLSWW
jgi:5'-nucleotidase